MDGFINPTAQNPLYPRAMRLEDFRPEEQFVSFEPASGLLLVTTPVTPWWEDTIAILGQNEEELARYPTLIANDVYGQPIRLPARGIHHYLAEDMRWANRFSVLAKRERIVELYFWLEKEGYPRAANRVKGIFFDFFIDDSFWDQLVWQQRP